MTDLATLGLAIDSSQVETATAKLSNFKGAADRAARSTEGLATGATRAATAQGQQSRQINTLTERITRMAAELVRQNAQMLKQAEEIGRLNEMINQQAKLYDMMTERVKRHGKSVQDSSGLARHELINLGRQAQDVAVSLAGGQSPLMVLMQQGTQIGDVFASSKASVKDAFKSIGASIASVLTPMRLLVVSSGAAAVGAYLLFESWKKTELQFKATADQVGATMRSLHGLDNNAAGKGLSTDNLLSGLSKFNEGVFDAQRGLGELKNIFAANGVHAKTFEDYLLGAADIIQRMPTYQGKLNQLQQMGLPATTEWVKFLSQGRDVLKDAMAHGSRFNAEAEGMARQAEAFDEKWSRGIKNLKDGFNGFFLDAIGWFTKLSDAGTAALIKIASYMPKAFRPDIAGNILRMSMLDNNGSRLTQDTADKFYNSVGIAGAAKPPGVDLDALKKQIALEQEVQSLMGSATTIAQRYALQHKELNFALLAGKLNQEQYNKAMRASNLSQENEELTMRVSILAPTPSVKQMMAGARQTAANSNHQAKEECHVGSERRSAAAA